MAAWGSRHVRSSGPSASIAPASSVASSASARAATAAAPRADASARRRRAFSFTSVVRAASDASLTPRRNRAAPRPPPDAATATASAPVASSARRRFPLIARDASMPARARGAPQLCALVLSSYTRGPKRRARWWPARALLPLSIARMLAQQ